MRTLYHSDNSYAAQKVRVYLAEKGIQWKSHHFNLLKQEHLLDEAYRKINPRGLVPALQDGEAIVCNSTEIMEYIAKTYLSENEKKSQLTDDVHDFCNNDELLHDPHLRTLSYYYLWMKKEASDEEKNRIVTLAKSHPDKARGEFLAKAIQRNFSLEDVEQSKIAIEISLKNLEKLLSNFKSEFLFGDEYTMADSAATVRLYRINSFEKNVDFQVNQYPLTTAYYEKMKQRQSFSEIESSYGK